MPHNFPTAIPNGDAVRSLRHALGLTQAELAARVKTHRVAIAQVERADRPFDVRTLGRVADALHIDVQEIIQAEEATAA